MEFKITKENKLKKIDELSKNNNDEGIDLLMDYLKDHDLEIRETAAKVIVKKSSNLAIKNLFQAINSDDPTYRNNALEALVLMGDRIVPYLIAEINNESSDVRKFVVDTLGEIKNEISIKYIIEKIDDENDNVAQSACESLGKFGTKEAVDALISALEKNEWIQFSAIEALGKIADPKAVSAILNLMKTGSDWIKFVALEALGNIKDESIIEELLPEIYSENEDLVKNVIISINKIMQHSIILKENPNLLLKKHTKFREKIEEFYIKFSEREVKIAIINLISIFSFNNFEDKLINDLIDTDDEISEAAMLCLISMGENIYPKLLYLLEHNNNTFELKIAIIYILGEILQNKKSYFHILKEYFENEKDELREIALEALSKIDNTEIAPYIKKAIEDRSPDVRRMALEIISKYNIKIDLRLIFELLGDKFEDVRLEAKKTLLKFDKEILKKNLLLELKNQKRNYQLNKAKLLMEILGEKEIKEGVGLILSLIEDHPELKILGIISLGNLKTRISFDYLLDKLRDEEVSARKMAADSLGKIGSPFVIESLKQCISDNDMWVRFFVVSSLNNYIQEDLYHLYIKRLELEEAIPVKIELLNGLAKYSNEHSFYDKVKVFLDDEDEDVVSTAIFALRNEVLENKELKSKILFLISAKSWKIKNVVLDILEKTGIEKKDLINILPLIRDDNEIIKEKSLKLLGLFGDLSIINPIMSTMQEDNLGELTRDLLLKVKEKGYHNFLLGLESEYDGVRVFTANALTIIGDQEAVELLIKALKDKNWKVRYFAAEALGNIGDQRALKALIKLLDDKQQYVINSSLQAIRKIGG